ncbi:putative low molecular weight protein-tyrosine-phosphatase AmsI [Pseudidiomarina piscicola]|uniref:protein-tyrosine-phosphatase n=1 Tax=Pseudidiomarina piscicola TaxID=2614830 RepID=A0A6S6WKB4_9GAMM|nr:low molecular weight protein-tyrosine-phosphatase [Pseudidiomarina piscicola]CAB0151201.1 putative low molecular weight protein-tyrosine-phosphatase AmsI [Pseudidiomarina piscicola]VZT40707.1 putative low molecular weight protein-tyrosine-phosphatase AmsI [Pseudomonas aeruginosa]
MFERIIVVCLGNICRSPTAKFMLQQALPNKHVDSAGITAMVRDGKAWEMDAKARAIAEANGYSFAEHRAQQLNRELVANHDLILVMDNEQRNYIGQRYPEALAKTMLLGHWLNKKEIPDPFKRSDEVYQHVFELIEKSCNEWKTKL